ncbi:MAG: serine/threonine protein kinase [bacterium]|nr:serine/threonine protein kinase [bacterium]
MSASDQARIDELLERCILALEERDDAEIKAILAANPEHAAVLQQRIDQLAQIGMLHRPDEDDLIPDQLGEFKLLQQIGRGGMGAVFMAEQENLQRRVALKLLRPDQLLFQGARERFRREVLAVARLAHPGIVPILTGGEVDGVPFYTMDLVQGASLAELLHELTGNDPSALDGTALRRALVRAMATKGDDTEVTDAPVFHGAWVPVCCRILLATAEAIHHAHERRVLHRDLKPSNVLLTANGEARVIDFGLAAAEGEQRITRSGASFGSVPYMAPEQARGEVERIDERTDVYGLGVTLYELLTLALPFGDGASTRDRLLSGDCEPPARRNPLVHPDVDAICLKAMDVDPGRRYRTAAELADDLRAFLEQRTVRARRPSRWLRLRRWGARNPMRAAALVLAFALLVPGPLVFAWQRDLAAHEIAGALDEAEYRLDQALEAVDLMLVRTADARLSEIPRTAELRRQLLEDAVEFHERLAGEALRTGDSQRIREARARSKARLGSLCLQLGDIDRAVENLTSAAHDCEVLMPDTADPLRLQLILASALRRLGQAEGMRDEYAKSEAAHSRAASEFRELAASAPNPKRIKNAVLAQLDVATSLGRLRRFDEATEILDRLDGELQPDNAASQLSELRRTVLRSEVSDHRGVILSRRGETRESLASFARAVALLDEVDDQLEPADRRRRLGLVERLGLMLMQRREFDRARPVLERAAKGYTELAAREPELPRWRERLAPVRGALAICLQGRGDANGALAMHDRVVEALGSLTTQFPGTPRYRRGLALAMAERAACQLALGQPDAAMTDFEQATLELEACLANNDSLTQAQGNLVAILANHASALRRLDRTEEARGVLGRALELARSIAEQRPSSRNDQMLINLLDLASELAVLENDMPRGLELFRECRRRAAESLARDPDDHLRQQTVARIALNGGLTLAGAGKLEEARACWESALAAARRAARGASPDRRLLALLLLRLAEYDSAHDALPAAKEWFRAALTETDITAKELPNYRSLQLLFEQPEFAAILADHRGGK